MMKEYSAASGQSMDSAVQEKIEHGLVLTTTYSGQGTVECAAAMVVDAYGSAEASPSKLVVYSACDCSPLSQKALQAHLPASRPRHVFTNILDRLYEFDRERLSGIAGEVLAKWKQVASQPLPKAEMNAYKAKLGTELRHRLVLALKDVEFRPDSWCIVHRQPCPLDPKLDPQFSKFLHVEAAGNTCVPWSSSGNHGGWLHECTLPLLVWACHMRYISPDGILNECTGPFEAECLDADIFQDMSSDIPRSPFGPAGGKGYSFSSIVFDATDLGIPSRRERRYSWWGRHGAMALDATDHSFESIFFRRMACTAAVFLQAPPEMLAEDIVQRGVKLMKLDRDSLVILNLHKVGSVLIPSQVVRLREYTAVTEQKGLLKDGLWRPGVACCLCDLSQNADFGATISVGSCLTLRRTSEVYDLVAGRPYHILEQMLVQGFPVPGLVDHKHSKHFPFPSLLTGSGRLSDNDLRVLSGNGMVLPAVGAFLMYALGASESSKPAT